MIAELELGNKTVIFDVHETLAKLEVDIDESDIIKEFSQQASMYAYLAALQASAYRKMEEEKGFRDMVYADADIEARLKFDKNGKKYTEAVIRSMVITSDEYIEADEAYLNSLYVHELLKGIVRASSMRADMLISIGATLRKEYDMTDMRIKEAKYDKSLADLKSSLRSGKQV